MGDFQPWLGPWSWQLLSTPGSRVSPASQEEYPPFPSPHWPGWGFTGFCTDPALEQGMSMGAERGQRQNQVLLRLSIIES